jgi:RNA polymerase sigma-70 factor, ECF subfamily
MTTAAMHAEEETDAALIRASVARPDAFVAVFRRHYDAVRTFAGWRVGPEQADEVASETFTRAFASRRSFRPVHEDARPWLLGIATNVLRGHWRTEQRRLAGLGRLEGDTAEDRPDPLARDLLDALAALPQVDREVLFLLAWADLTYEQIAVALDIPLGTVRSRISRARGKLDSVLAAARAWDAFPEEWRRAGRENARAALADFRNSIGEYPSATDLATVTVRTVCSYGARSPSSMFRLTRSLASAIPSARTQRIEGAGHAASFDATTNFVRLIADAMTC